MKLFKKGQEEGPSTLLKIIVVAACIIVGLALIYIFSGSLSDVANKLPKS